MPRRYLKERNQLATTCSRASHGMKMAPTVAGPPHAPKTTSPHTPPSRISKAFSAPTTTPPARGLLGHRGVKGWIHPSPRLSRSWGWGVKGSSRRGLGGGGEGGVVAAPPTESTPPHGRRAGPPTTVREWLECFNPVTNFWALFSPEPGDMQFIAGLRAFTALYDIAFHMIQLWPSYRRARGIFVPFEEVEWFAELARGFPIQFIFHGAAGVDIYLTILGFLTMRMLTKELRRRGRIDFPVFLARRLFRIVPMLTYGVYMDVWKGLDETNCSATGWQNILFVQNYEFSDKFNTCLSISFSVAIEVQMYFISPFIAYLACLPTTNRRYGQGGKGGAGGWDLRLTELGPYRGVIVPLTFAFFTIAFKIVMLASQVGDSDNFYETKSMYFSTHSRGTSWFLGMAGGFLLATREAVPEKYKFKWEGMMKTMCDVVVVVMFFFVMYAGVNLFGYHAPHIHYSKSLQIFLSLFGRSVISGSAAYFMVNAASGQGWGWLARFFGHSIWRPFARLGLAGYLLQFVGMFQVADFIWLENANGSLARSETLFVFYGVCGVMWTYGFWCVIGWLLFEKPVVEMRLHTLLQSREERERTGPGSVDDQVEEEILGYGC